MMKYRVNKRTGDLISEIGIGSSYMFGAGMDEAVRALRLAVEGGINYFDLAAGDGTTFPIYGKALHDVRKNIFFQIHFGADYAKGTYGWSLKLDTIKRSVEKQLRELRTDYIDYGFIHCQDEISDWETYLKNGVENNLWATDTWNFGTGYPRLNYVAINKFVEISTKEQLLNLQGQTLWRNYRLTANIDLGGINWSPIVLFSGTFDGSGYTISNFKITSSGSKAGLFGRNAGTIKNLGVEDFTINTSAPYVGGLVGYNISGIITNCHAIGNISARSQTVGGLVGYNSKGTIINSFASVNITSTITASSNTTYKSNAVGIRAGGLIGYNSKGIITNCYATGDVKVDVTTSFSSYATYSSNASTYAGGLVGYNSYGEITNCYATGDVSAISTAISSHSQEYGVASAAASNAGGLVGWNDWGGVINNCYATGNVVSTSNSTAIPTESAIAESSAGGLVGRNNGGEIFNSYAIGDVTSIYTVTPNGSDRIYAVAGGVSGSTGGTITNCYSYNGQTFTVKKNGATTYSPTNTSGATQSQTNLQSSTFHIQTLGWDSEIWEFTEGTYPTLKNN